MLTKRPPAIDQVSSAPAIDQVSLAPEEKTKFRIDSKSWFLTYPKLDLSKEMALQLLILKLSGKTVQGAVVCRELHEDGSPHIHAYILLEKQICCRDVHFWDIAGHHGNYQKARNIKAVAKYIRKDGDFVEYGTLDWQEKVLSVEEKRRYVNKIMTDPDTTLKDLLQDDHFDARQAHHLQKALAACKQAIITPCETEDVKGIWIFGPAGMGKSHLVRELEPSLFLKAQNKWWDGYEGQRAVLIDDFDKMGMCLSHYLKIWADRYGCDGEKKGSTIPLAHERLYITSNYSPDELWGAHKEGEKPDLELIAAIKRRFTFHYLESRDNYEAVKARLIK